MKLFAGVVVGGGGGGFYLFVLVQPEKSSILNTGGFDCLEY